MSFVAIASTDINVIINQLYFPGWVIKANGKEIPVTITSTGEMSLRLSSGTHIVNAVFRNTPIRIVGNMITTLTGITMLFVFILQIRKNYV